MDARMAKPSDPEWLTAAECASRTGLTVRALRVYEREGLIHPPRSAKGWRRYGSTELGRLNSIVILKALGLTLTQIRTVLTENPPSLLRILEIHEEQWKAKRETAERALSLVAVAQERLRTHQTLSIDELCDLIKGLEKRRSPTMSSQSAVTRELINKHTTADEERAWHTWWAAHPEDVAENKSFVEDQNALFRELQHLADAGADPASSEVQTLLGRHNELLRRYKVRERAARQLAWSRSVTTKFWGMGAKARNLEIQSPPSRGADLFLAAIRQSTWGQALVKLLSDVCKLTEVRVDPASPDADAVVGLLCEICRDHALGDPYTYTQWGPFIARINRPDLADGTYDLQWEFLARALLARNVQKAVL